jgi:hypothetical protein
MSRTIFQDIRVLSCLRFDDKETSKAVTSVMQTKAKATNARSEMFGETCISSYIRGRNVRVDEHLCSLRGRYYFEVYITSKPGKCGMKTWLCLPVLCKSQMYMGRVAIAKETERSKRILRDMLDHLSGSGINVTSITSSPQEVRGYSVGITDERDLSCTPLTLPHVT